ncbi:hypothetical protein ALQ48_04363 [Pseudomonas coronafaciens pv. zizaniae]|nr:hypothetical protein ALQ48_04363 [Pseudomonas coronafaciens pv. zizaniae]
MLAVRRHAASVAQITGKVLQPAKCDKTVRLPDNSSFAPGAAQDQER